MIERRSLNEGHTSPQSTFSSKTTGKKFSFSSLQAGRGIAATLVVVFHAGIYIGADPRFWLKEAYAKYTAFGRFGVEFFFVLSGLVIMLAHWNDQGRPAALGSYIWKRFRRIFPVYWIVLFPALIVSILRPTMNGGPPDLWGIITSVLLIHLNAEIGPIHVAWTLFHEVLFYLVFSLIIFKRMLGYICLAIWMLASVVMLFHPFGSALTRDYLSHLHILFFFGMILAVLVKKQIRLSPRVLLVASLAISLFLYPWTLHHGPPPQDPGVHGIYSVIAGVMFFCLILAVVTMEMHNRLTVPAWLILLGDASYAIYLIHFPVLSIFVKVLFHISQHRPSLLPLVLLAQVLVGVGAGLLFHLWVEKPLLRLIPARRAA